MTQAIREMLQQPGLTKRQREGLERAEGFALIDDHERAANLLADVVAMF